MRVSLKATYGIIAALDLALNTNGDGPVQAKAIAKRQAVPIRFLEQVLLAMKKAGLVESLRGAQGGYVLNKPPSEITLAEIVEALDGSLSLKSAHVTRLRRAGERAVIDKLLGTVWERVRQAELDVLSAVTLRELAERHRQMVHERAPMYHI
jgi:Rrf2 family protein